MFDDVVAGVYALLAIYGVAFVLIWVTGRRLHLPSTPLLLLPCPPPLVESGTLMVSFLGNGSTQYSSPKILILPGPAQPVSTATSMAKMYK